MARSSCAAMVLLVLTGIPRLAYAQVGTEVRGIVRDETGGPIAGATITLTDSHATETSASTDWLGRYHLSSIAPGTATLTVTAPGFAPSSRLITTTSTGAIKVDVRLRVTASTRVDVHGGLTGVSLGSGQNMSTITLSGSNLDLLPSDPEALLHTLRLLAGTTGTRADQVVFYIDGAPIDRRLPPKDIIQTIRINANPFSAEFAEPGPSRIDIITKPASAQFHGDARVEFNDSKFNARNQFEPVRPPVQLRTYTGYVSGPIVQNRWSLLLYGGRWEQDENAVVDATTINPLTLQTEAVRLNVATPSRTLSYSVKSDALLSRQHILVVEFGQDRQHGRNAGLLSGFDLPERAYATNAEEQTASLRLTSTFSNHVLNEFRVHESRHQTLDQAGSSAPAILVLEGFNAGGNEHTQLRNNSTNEVTLSNVTSLLVGQHSVRFGAVLRHTQLTQIDRANYNGTFTFGTDVVRNALGNAVLDASGEPTAISGLELYRQTIAGVPGARPSQFSIVRGDPAVAFPVGARAAFAQDDWLLSPRLTASYGARIEYQQDLLTHVTIAPRAGIAWAPSSDGRSALRTGFGLFYSPLPQTLVSDVLRSRQSELFFVNRPAFFPTVPDALPASQALITTRTEAPDLGVPWLALSTVSLDRQIGPRLFGSIGYTWKRGVNLLRTRVVSASAANGPTLQFESTGSSSAHEFHLTASGTVSSWLSLFSSYDLSRARQDTDSAYTVPADSGALASEWGPALIPVHQIAAGASVNLPGDIQLIPFFRATSPLPFNITTGSDNNGDTQFADRPSLVDTTDPSAIVTPYGAFNVNPAPGQIVIPRNSGRGPTELTLDLTASWLSDRVLTSTDRATISITVNNLTNRVNYAPYNGVLTSPFFGTANRAQNPRRITLTLRYDF